MSSYYLQVSISETKKLPNDDGSVTAETTIELGSNQTVASQDVEIQMALGVVRRIVETRIAQPD